MSAKATKTTAPRRRSSRIRSKQKTETEKAEASKEEEVEEDEQVSDNTDDKSFKMKLRNRSSDNAKEQDMVNLKDDIHTKYTHGDCVWAKYLDYPWWPGQVEIDSTKKRARKRPKTISVRWFGEGFPEQVNNCKLAMVVPWDPNELDRIYLEVDEEDTKCFQDSVAECNDAYLKICQERGEEPIKAALVFDEQHQERGNCTTKSLPKTTKAKMKKAAPKRKIAKKTKRAVKKKKEEEAEEEDASKAEEQAEDAAAHNGLPELEPVSGDDTKESEQQEAVPPEAEPEEDISERKKSLRSGGKKSKLKPRAKAKPKASPTTQSKTKRKQGRRRKDSTGSSASSHSESEQNATESPPKNKRGRKRKYEETMNGDNKPEKEKTEDESAEKAKEKGKESKEEQEDEKDEYIRVQKKKMVGVRRSARVNKKPLLEEEEDNNVDIAGNEKYADLECEDNLNAAFAECTATHSASDFTPWIALFYFGMRTYSKSGDTDGDFINTVANTFQLEEEKVLRHLSEFVETQSGNPRKKRRKNTA